MNFFCSEAYFFSCSKSFRASEVFTRSCSAPSPVFVKAVLGFSFAVYGPPLSLRYRSYGPNNERQSLTGLSTSSSNVLLPAAVAVSSVAIAVTDGLATVCCHCYCCYCCYCCCCCCDLPYFCCDYLRDPKAYLGSLFFQFLCRLPLQAFSGKAFSLTSVSGFPPLLSFR